MPAIAQDTAPGDITIEAEQDDSFDKGPGTKYPEVQDALIKFGNRDFEGAMETLQGAFVAHPELPPPGIILGEWYARAKSPGAARNSFERAVRDNPGDPQAYVVFGDNALQTRRFTDAILLYEKAKSVCQSYNSNPDRKKNLMIRALRGVAAVASAREDWASAESALQDVLKLSPNDPNSMTRLGRAMFMQDREQEAYDLFKRLYEVDPEKMVRHEINMARLYQQADREANAEKLMTRARERDPKTLTTQLAVAQWALETNKLELAQQAASAAKEIDPDTVQVRLLEGVLARMKSDYSGAETAFRKANQISPSNAVVLNQLAISLASQGDQKKKEQAVEFAQMATKIFPDRSQLISRESNVTLAWVLHKLNKANAAQTLLQQTLGAGPIGPDSSYLAAEILHEIGRSDNALILLKNAIENGKGIFPSKAAAERLLRKIRGN